MVQVHCHPSPIEVSYKAVRSIVPSLIFADESSKPNFDIVVHMGMTNRPFYALETQARRDGFVKDDVTDSQLLDPEFWENQYGAPEVLKTGFDCEKTLYNWKKNLQVKGPSSPFPVPGYKLTTFMHSGWRRCQVITSGRVVFVRIHVLHRHVGILAEGLERGNTRRVLTCANWVRR